MNQKPPCRGNKKYSRATGFAPVTMAVLLFRRMMSNGPRNGSFYKFFR
jgi:hypothetical protein